MTEIPAIEEAGNRNNDANNSENINLTHYPLEEPTKETNPKDAVAIGKVPFSVIPAQVLGNIGLALMEGALKYGRHNYRGTGIRFSVYYDATMRHLTDWWEGQDIDPDSGECELHHVDKAIASLVVLSDAIKSGMLEDDRPPVVGNKNWIAELGEKAKKLLKMYPVPKKAFTEKNRKRHS